METIFKALRALRKNHRDLLLGKEAEGLANALLSFDRTNRGHQHQLDRLAATATQPYPPSAENDTFRTRWWSFRYSMQELIAALPNTPKTAIPWQGDFQALWNARDDSGCLEHFCKQYMQSYLHNSSAGLPQSLRLQGVSLELAGGRLQLAVAIQHREHPSLQATLRMVMVCERLDSLGACLLALQEFRRKTKDLLSKADAMPEFSVERKEAATAAICKKKLRDMLAQCSSEERAWFAKNWSQADPQRLPSGQLVTF